MNTTKAKKTIAVDVIRSKDSVRYGRKFEGAVAVGHKASIVVDESITLFGESHGNAYSKTFKIGDSAEYDSYNLSYTGEIIAIGKKTISIKHPHSDRVSRLDLHTFDWRNYDLDLDAIADRNLDVLMHC